MVVTVEQLDERSPGDKTDNISDIEMEESNVLKNQNPDTDGCGNYHSRSHVHNQNDNFSRYSNNI